MSRYTTILFLLCFSSCTPRIATEQEKKEIFNAAHFDTSITNNIFKYKPLKNFLQNNLDTLINYRNGQNEAFMQDKDQASTTFQNEDCYPFYQKIKNGSKNDITHVPGFLVNQLDSLYNMYGRYNTIIAFTICRNGKITLVIHYLTEKKTLLISHELIWNSKTGAGPEYELQKDTTLDDDLIYRIGLEEIHRR